MNEIIVTVVSVFVILGVFLGLAKWIIYLTVKPIWVTLATTTDELKTVRAENADLKAQMATTTANNKVLVTESMADVVGQITAMSGHYAEARAENAASVSAIRLKLAEEYTTKNDLEREFDICRNRTRCGDSNQ